MSENVPVNEKQSIFERIKLYLIKPSKFFESYKENPKVLIHLVIIMIISAITAMITSSKTPELVEGNVEGVSGEQLEMAKKMTEIFSSPVFVIGAAIVMIVLYYLAFALIRYMITKISNGEGTYKHMFSLVVVTSYPVVIMGLVKSFLPIDVPTEVSMFDTFLGKVNIFSIWQLVLLIIGMSVVFNISKKKSIIINVVIFLVSLGFLMAFSYIGTMAPTMIQ